MVNMQNGMVQDARAMGGMFITDASYGDKDTDMADGDDYSDDFSSDYSDESSYDSDWSDAGMDHAQVESAFIHKSSSSPALMAALMPSLVNKDTIRRQNLMRVDSTPTMSFPQMPASLLARMQKAETVIGDSNATFPLSKALLIPPQNVAPEETPVSPQDMFSKILTSRGVNSASIPAADLTDNFFLRMTEANISGYDMAKATAMRTEDIACLRRMLSEGQNLQVCNQFGESVLHSACRRSSTSILHFLVAEARLSLKVVDDYGRTPMHDACWTNKPNFQLARIVLSSCPDLLLVADKRGFTPLQYIRKDLWAEWVGFLDANHDMIMPREILRPL